MENPSLERLTALEKKVELVYESVKKTRKYFMWALISSIVIFIIPLIGLAIAIPSFIGTYSQINEITSDL